MIKVSAKIYGDNVHFYLHDRIHQRGYRTKENASKTISTPSGVLLNGEEYITPSQVVDMLEKGGRTVPEMLEALGGKR